MVGNSQNCRKMDAFSFYPDSPIPVDENPFSVRVYGDTLNVVFTSDITATGEILVNRWENHGCLGGTRVTWTATRLLLPDLATCIQIPSDSTTKFPAQEPEEAKNAPDGTCLIMGDVVFIKRSPQTLLAAEHYLAWIPDRQSVEFNGFFWATWGPDQTRSGGLVQENDRLEVPGSRLPIIQWEEDTGYLALINFYEVIPK